MINKIYQLIEPFQFIETYRSIDINNNVIIRPLLLAICKADQRYFTGNRTKAVLSKKMPMALIHEAVGEVVYDGSNTFAQGDRVAMIPNTPNFFNCDFSENYIPGKFRGSGYDGFMQEFVDMDPRRLIKINDIPLESSIMCETLSVAYHGIFHILTKYNSTNKEINIAVIGDGPIAFSASLLLKFCLENANIFIFGKHKTKINKFDHINHKTTQQPMKSDYNKFDLVFECVGGNNQNGIIIEAIKLLKPEGTIVLLGISENNFNFKARDLLEKGITIIGRSRSGYKDFLAVKELLKNPDFNKHIKNLISDTINVKSLKEIVQAFQKDLNNDFKTVIEWSI